MERKIVSGIMLTLFLLISMLTLAFNIQPVKASGTIYIRADGSIDPPTAPIQRNGDLYTLTDSIYSDTSGIVIERNNMTLNGAGYTVQGIGGGSGIDLTGRSNVTIKNMVIKTYGIGIFLSGSSRNDITTNNITANNGWGGIIINSPSSNNKIYQNNIFNNTTPWPNLAYGIWDLGGLSSGNLIKNNMVSHNDVGIRIGSSGNTLVGNIMEGNNFANFGASAENDIGLSNIADGKPIYYVKAVSNAVYSSLDVSALYIVDSFNVTVRDLKITTPNVYGIYFYNTNSSRIENTTISNNFVGILLQCSSNNTIQNSQALNNYCMRSWGGPRCGIWIAWESNNNTLIKNTASDNYDGIIIQDLSWYNTLSDNTVSENQAAGIKIMNYVRGGKSYECNYNKLSENNVSDNSVGIDIYVDIPYGVSYNNTFVGNTLLRNLYGIVDGGYNKFYHNNFINNIHQVGTAGDTWDDGYPSGGNYWSDYAGIDVKSGPDQDVLGSDSMGDTPYVIDGSNRDRYPLINPYGGLLPRTLTITVTTGGTTNPIPEIHAYAQGQSICVHATPSTGYMLDHWELDSVNVGSINPIIVTMDIDHTLHAVLIEHHNVAVTNVTPSKTVVGQGYSLNISVTVANQGDYTETFNVTVYANTTSIATQTVTLTSGNSTTITCTWNTTGFAKGNYTISAYAWPVPSETHTTDNTFSDGWVIVSIVGDITGPYGWPDGKCDMRDIRMVAKLFGVSYPDPRYNPNCDVTGPTQGVADGKIDMRDIRAVAKQFGKTDS